MAEVTAERALPEFLEQEGGSPTAVPSELLTSLPDVNVTPIVPEPALKLPTAVRSFDLAPPRSPADPSPAPAVFRDRPDSPFVMPRVQLPRVPLGDARVELRADPLARPGPERIGSHGTATEWAQNHCPNSACTFPRGHSPPCSNHLPNDGHGFNPDAPRALRPLAKPLQNDQKCQDAPLSMTQHAPEETSAAGRCDWRMREAYCAPH